MLRCFCSCCNATPLLHILIFVSVTNVQLLTLDNKTKYSGASLLKSWTILEIVVGFNQMHAEGVVGIVDRVMTRYRRDPTCLLQILREVQEACDWIPPEAIDRMQAVLGVPRTKIEGSKTGASQAHHGVSTKYRGQFIVLRGSATGQYET